ncbi:MAG: hypothetical protein SH857_06530 [Chitinophagales bacterium]|nr:hypothetical protein [Chitinophagales bacterium]
MKKMLWLLPLFFWCGLLFAQTPAQSFVIVNSGSVRNIQAYIAALNGNDIDKYRHIDQRTTMLFQEGVEVKLLSATEMQALGLPVDLSAVNTTAVDRMRHSQFKLHESGRILELVTPVKKGQ